MTLGEKLKEARKQAALSQEQLSEKLGISRSAVAKWETDKGLPDVGNLKVLARLLSVSVDQLLDETEVTDEAMIRESYNLAAYGRGCKKVKKDRVVRDKFPDAKIYSLLGRQELMDLDQFAGSALDCQISSQDLIKDADKAFYLIEKENRQFFVTVTDTFVEIRPLEQPMQSNSFTIDGWNFIKCNYEIGI